MVEDTPTVYNLLVCTLCSCYPISILGMAPSWYKVRLLLGHSNAPQYTHGFLPPAIMCPSWQCLPETQDMRRLQ